MVEKRPLIGILDLMLLGHTITMLARATGLLRIKTGQLGYIRGHIVTVGRDAPMIRGTACPTARVQSSLEFPEELKL